MLKIKKGLLLPQTIIKLIISIIIFAALLFFVIKIINFFFLSQEEEKAKITLENIKLTLQRANINEEKTASYLLLPLKGWSIVFIPSNLNKFENFEKVEMYQLLNVVCICKKKCKYCFPYKPIFDEKNSYLKVNLEEIKSITFFDKGDYVLFIINEEEIPISPLSKEEEKKFKEIVTTKENIINMAKEKAKSYGISSEIIIGIIYVESNFTSDAVSLGGAVGLMQLIPSTALEYGLKVSMKNPNNNSEIITFIKEKNYLKVERDGKEEKILIKESLHETYIDYMNKNNLWVNCNGYKVSPCNWCHKEYCTEKDERFNPEKNLEAGIKHFKSLLEYFKYKYDYAIAAYNIGAGKIKKDCECANNGCKKLSECANKEVILYVEKVKSISINKV